MSFPAHRPTLDFQLSVHLAGYRAPASFHPRKLQTHSPLLEYPDLQVIRCLLQATRTLVVANANACPKSPLIPTFGLRVRVMVGTSFVSLSLTSHNRHENLLLDLHSPLPVTPIIRSPSLAHPTPLLPHKRFLDVHFLICGSPSPTIGSSSSNSIRLRGGG